MARIRDLIGVEAPLADVGDALREAARDIAPAAVGGLHVTCADETEAECARAFAACLADQWLPELKPGHGAPMRVVNLGARYETGAVAIAEEHYATPRARDGRRLLIVKINAHVGVQPAPDGPQYGRIDRYGNPSACCGALSGLFNRSALPAIDEIRDALGSEGRDRLSVLDDPTRVPLGQRALLTAVSHAAVQARRAVADIERLRPETPTLFLALPCVTINRVDGPDTEIILGLYQIDQMGGAPQTQYLGLGDNPATYRVAHPQGRLMIEDDRWPDASR